jgi:GxxExxY protein
MQRNVISAQNKEIPLLEKELTNRIIGAAIEVHKALGRGLLESAYQLCMAHESTLQKMPFEQQVPLKVQHKGIELDGGYRLDFIFDKRVILEIKTVEVVFLSMKPNCSLT